jgi:hypothetical protein
VGAYWPAAAFPKACRVEGSKGFLAMMKVYGRNGCVYRQVSVLDLWGCTEFVGSERVMAGRADA